MDRFTSHSDLALMLSGGGARAAYQVGFLRLLAREFPEVVPGILTGVSAGGINAAYLATHQESFAVKVEHLAEVWAGIRIDDVFRVELRDLATRTLRWGGRLLGGGKYPLTPARSLVDTAPLRELVGKLLTADGGHVPGIAQSLEAGWLRAIALTASSYTTGQSVTWVQTREDCGIEAWERPQRKSTRCRLGVEHVMASAALPFFFPAVEVDGNLVWRRRHPAHCAALAGRASWRDPHHGHLDSLRALARGGGPAGDCRLPAARAGGGACCTTPSSSISSMATRWRCGASTT